MKLIKKPDTTNSELEKKVKEEKKSAEYIFFSYAFPCFHELRQANKISSEYYTSVLKNFEKGITPDTNELEKLFPRALDSGLRVIARYLNKNPWDKEVVIKYWREGFHNKIIDKKQGIYSKTPDAFNEFCKVHKARVINLQNNFIEVEYDSKKIKVLNELVRNVKEGDYITVHFGYAIEKI